MRFYKSSQFRKMQALKLLQNQQTWYQPTPHKVLYLIPPVQSW